MSIKVLYLTDNRESYAQGFYYEDWLHAFKKRFQNLIVYGPGYPTLIDEIPSKIDLVVYGHSFLDVLAKRERSDFFGKKKFQGLDFRKFRNIPSILFSKNEYKRMEERIDFVKKIDRCLLIVNSKETLLRYEKQHEDIKWIPFGINRDIFFNQKQVRSIDIGMRGNKHISYIGELRTKVADRLISSFPYLSMDIKLSANGEDFLIGQDYPDWLNVSRFSAHTRSAMEMNAKFAEIIACGSIPLCPYDDYEGLLTKDQHYVDIEDILKIKSKEQFDEFYSAKLHTMKPYFEKYVEKYDYDVLLSGITEKLDII